MCFDVLHAVLSDHVLETWIISWYLQWYAAWEAYFPFVL